jgi:SAM-dependent methyltransferase
MFDALVEYNELHILWAKAHAANSPTKYVRNKGVFSVLSSLTPGATLDVGCGTGEYSIFLARRGHEMTAIDPSSWAIEMFLDRGGGEFGVHASVSSLEEFMPTKDFDNILAIEVLEHIERDIEAIRRLHDFLKKGGSMVISVPATPFLYGEGDRISGHYRRYSIGNLKRVLSVGGFETIEIRRYGFPMLFVYAVLRKLFLDRTLIAHFASSGTKPNKKMISLSKVYPFVFFLDCASIPLFSVGYIAKCTK